MKFYSIFTYDNGKSMNKETLGNRTEENVEEKDYNTLFIYRILNKIII